MWPSCQKCTAAVPKSNDKYCGGKVCLLKGDPLKPYNNGSKHSPYTKKKVTRAQIKVRRKRGRK